MLTGLPATELRRMLDARQVSAPEVLQAHLDAIAARNPKLNAVLHVAEDRARTAAEAAQVTIDAGKAGPLTGIPVLVKDNIHVRDLPTTCASRMLEGFVAPFDSHVSERLHDAGAVVIGKTNLDEFAMGASTETGCFGPAANPWDPDRSPGGSSGGSAAGVAAGLAPLALGSDTGGSIRQPAALCGVVGFKPTYGRCSRYGLVAFGSSLDQIGPMARTVEDAALLASAITGRDPRDSTSLDLSPISTDTLRAGSLKGKRFGVPVELLAEGIAPGVREGIESVLRKIEAEGAAVEEIHLPSVRYGVTTYYIIAPAEASSNLARYDGVRYGLRAEGDGHIGLTERSRAQGFGHEVKMRIMIGTYALSAGYYDAYYLKAQQVRALMVREFNEAFQSYDAILSPTSPVVAFKIGALLDDPLALKTLDYCTLPANMGGFPGLSVHAGFSEGLPIGLQIVGPVLADEKVLNLGWHIEQLLGAAPMPPSP